jgi:hypothetical protein
VIMGFSSRIERTETWIRMIICQSEMLTSCLRSGQSSDRLRGLIVGHLIGSCARGDAVKPFVHPSGRPECRMLRFRDADPGAIFWVATRPCPSGLCEKGTEPAQPHSIAPDQCRGDLVENGVDGLFNILREPVQICCREPPQSIPIWSCDPLSREESRKM